MKVELCSERLDDWNEYINSKDAFTLYYLDKWKDIIEKSFGCKSYYLKAVERRICGVLPLFLLKSRIFGIFFVSVPFFNYGGICADNNETGKLLLKEAVEIAKRQGVSHIELRQTEKMDLGLPVKENKVTMVLKLNSDPDVVWKKLKDKVRNEVRKAERSGCYTETGKKDKLDEFYNVFAANMRDLGTPVYGKVFFKNIIDSFPDLVEIFVVKIKEAPVAAGFTLKSGNKVEVPWASSLRKYNKSCPNMMLYWGMIKNACLNEYEYFDFGRCSKGGGTYNFKKQWGGEEKQLYWQYWLAEGNTMPEINPQNPKYRLFVWLWQKLPVFITKIIGPGIVKNIP